MLPLRFSAVALAAIVGLSIATPIQVEAQATKAGAESGSMSTTAQATSKTTRTAGSPCKGLSRSACGAASACTWIQPKKKTDVRGRKLTPYCRKVAKRKTN